MTRAGWPKQFPDVLVHGAWSRNDIKLPCLKRHPLYAAAKGERDMRSAIQIVDDLANKDVLDGLKYIVEENGGAEPLIIAPSAQPGDSNNALAIGYAQWLSHEMGWDVEERVFQKKAFSRDQNGVWFRMAHCAVFTGEIDIERPYVIVDDVITVGGTLADLRSFIVNQGGKVIGMSTIASGDGRDKPIRLTDLTHENLERRYGSSFKESSVDVLGYPFSCFTEREGQEALSCSGYDQFRTKILRERDT